MLLNGQFFIMSWRNWNEQMLRYSKGVPSEQTKHNDSRLFVYSLLIWRKEHTYKQFGYVLLLKW